MTPAPTRRSLRTQTAPTTTVDSETGPLSRREARHVARSRAAAMPTEAIDVVAAPEPVEVHVEPIVVAEPLIAAQSAAEPASIAEPAIDEDETPELVEAMVEDGPAHTILDDIDEPAADSAEDVDAFAEASRAFAFTGEVPTQGAVAVAAPSTPAAAHPAPRRRRSAAMKRITAASVSVGAMAIVGLLTVGLTTPAEAVAAALPGSTELAGDVAGVAAAGAAYADIQAYVVPSNITESPLDRPESYSIGTMIDLAGTEGITNYSSQYFTNDINCPIQWPFATGTTISYGFGYRGSEFHEGVDFTPGDGAHVQAVADGVVSTSTDSGGMFGVTIVIDIVVDGKPFSIRYGHMQYGSRQVEVGDHVEVGEYIGRTGDTGYSFGAHTHVEVLQNGTTPIDPMPWFQQYATC